jgi:hypothetical protein
MATRKANKRPTAPEKKLAAAENKLTALVRDNDRLKTVNKAQSDTLTLARQANTALSALVLHGAMLLRSAADQFEVRGAVPTAQLYRMQADRLDPPPLKAMAADCQGEMSEGFKGALASLGQPANLQLDRGAR